MKRDEYRLDSDSGGSVAWIQTGSTIIFKPYPLAEALRGLAEAGFVNVEIGAVKEFLEHLDPDDPDVDGCRALLAEHGLTCVSMSGHAPLHQEVGVRRLRNVLAAGQELGIKVLNTFTGDAEGPEEVAAFKANARGLADEAESLGIRLCIETDSNLLPTAAVGMKLLGEIGHPWIGINYDPGNVVYYTGAKPEEDIRLALPRLGHFHLKDKRGGEGVLDFPAPGEGDLDLEGMLRDVAGSGFSGPVSMEIEFVNYEWPSWEECVEAAKRGKAYWDGLGL
jgi:L-ribulose-5-phosphate 3-epimerase